MNRCEEMVGVNHYVGARLPPRHECLERQQQHHRGERDERGAAELRVEQPDGGGHLQRRG